MSFLLRAVAVFVLAVGLIGLGGPPGVAAEPEVSAAAVPVGPAKRVPVALSASTLDREERVSSGAVRFPFATTAPVSRWRLHVRNHNDRTGRSYAGGAEITGIWVGRHDGTGGFVSSPARVSRPFTLPGGGAEVVSSWSRTPLGPDDMLISVGWTDATGANTASPAGAFRSENADAAASASAGGFRRATSVPFSWWIEVETPETTPVVALWGDSIGTGIGNSAPLHESPLALYARGIKALPVHHSYPGIAMTSWRHDDFAGWHRWKGLARPDAVIHFMGQNDLASAGDLATMKRRFASTIGLLRRHIADDVYLATLTPDGGKGPETNRLRREYNAWLSTRPYRTAGTFDFSAAVSNATHDALAAPFDSGDAVHLTSLGSAALAERIALNARPAPVLFTEECGISSDGYTIPQSVGVDYVADGRTLAPGWHQGRGTVTVLAQAQAGFQLSGRENRWTHTFDRGSPFTDVTTSAQFFDEMCWLASEGISTGWDTPRGKEYRPLTAVNRDAMAAFMYRLAGSPAYTAPATSPFVDVPTTNQFYKEISWLASEGISSGWDTPRGKEYRPVASVNRDAMAAFMYRLAGSPTYTAPSRSPFIDVPISNQFYKEISWLASEGISTGWDTPRGKEYRPIASVNRDAMAAFMHRLAERNLI